MGGSNNTTIKDENDSQISTLGWLLDNHVPVATLATAIERHGIYTWDRFGRFGLANEAGKNKALCLLEVQYEWECDAGARYSSDPRSPLDQSEGFDNPYAQFGWPDAAIPDFANLNKSNQEAPLMRPGASTQSEKPWLVHHSPDPQPKHHWYTPARYFARAFVKEDETLLKKRDILAKKVADKLAAERIFKRGGKKPLDPTTVKKAFIKVI